MNKPLCIAIAVACLSLAAGQAVADEQYKRVSEVFVGGTTVADEPIVYPAGQAEVHAVVVTLLPGEETGWHVHGVPLFGYVLAGEVTVDYGPRGRRTYRSETGFLEAMATAHNGRNSGTEPCRILAVFIGAEGLPSTRSVLAPSP